MIDGVPVGWIAQGGAAAALIVVVVLIVRGYMSGAIVARRTVDQLRAVQDARIVAAEKREDNYREALTVAQATIAEQARQLDELLAIARTTSAAVASLPQERRR